MTSRVTSINAFVVYKVQKFSRSRLYYFLFSVFCFCFCCRALKDYRINVFGICHMFIEPLLRSHNPQLSSTSNRFRVALDTMLHGKLVSSSFRVVFCATFFFFLNDYNNGCLGTLHVIWCVLMVFVGCLQRPQQHRWTLQTVEEELALLYSFIV